MSVVWVTASSLPLSKMKIKHALRPDGRWDTWGQSKLRSTQRTLYRDTLEQITELNITDEDSK